MDIEYADVAIQTSKKIWIIYFEDTILEDCSKWKAVFHTFPDGKWREAYVFRKVLEFYFGNIGTRAGYGNGCSNLLFESCSNGWPHRWTQKVRN